MTQQALRREDDQRQRIDGQERRLAAQQMKVLRRGRAVGDAHVDVGGELKEPLRPRAGVIGALAFVRRAAAASRATAPGPTSPRADSTNSSSIVWAPLMKSPYCASQITSRSGAWML